MRFKSVLTAACIAVLAAGAGAANAAPVFVQSVESFTAGTGNRGDVVGGGGGDPMDTRSVRDKVLGAPDGKFLSLGFGGSIVLGFGSGPFQDASVLFEVTNNCATGGTQCGHWLESVNVYSSMNLLSFGDAGWESVGSISNSAAPDVTQGNTRGYQLNVAAPFLYLMLVDNSSVAQSGNSNAGWDIDAVSVAPIPVPAALPLLLAGLGGIAFVGRRRNKAA